MEEFQIVIKEEQVIDILESFTNAFPYNIYIIVVIAVCVLGIGKIIVARNEMVGNILYLISGILAFYFVFCVVPIKSDLPLSLNLEGSKTISIGDIKSYEREECEIAEVNVIRFVDSKTGETNILVSSKDKDISSDCIETSFYSLDYDNSSESYRYYMSTFVDDIDRLNYNDVYIDNTIIIE